MKIPSKSTGSLCRSWWDPAKLQGKNVDFRDIDQKLVRFKAKVDFLYGAVFGAGPRSKVTYVPPYVHSSYEPGPDELCFSLGLIVEPEYVQHAAILHEFRHRIVSTGQAALFTEFSSFRTFVSDKEEQTWRETVMRRYPSDKWEKEIDAYIVSSAARQLMEVGVKPGVVRSVLFRSS